jgi:hypothetical protein
MSHQRMTRSLIPSISRATLLVVQRRLAVCGAALWLVLLAVQSVSAQPVAESSFPPKIWMSSLSMTAEA